MNHAVGAGNTQVRHTRHPRGLYLLFATEMWERMSYYGMRCLLVLFLVDTSSGWGWSTADALALYGTYTGLVYLTPIAGGYIADNLIGQRKAVVFGGTLMMIGHLLLAIPRTELFYAGLGCLILGNGFFKPNISTMVGRLYPANDSRRDSAFTIFYMGVNLGVFLGVTLCGLVGEKWGWHYGFGLAGVGMLLGLVTFLLLAKRLLGIVGMAPHESPAARFEAKVRVACHGVAVAVATAGYFAAERGESMAQHPYAKWIVALAALAAGHLVTRALLSRRSSHPAGPSAPLTREERHRVASIFIISLFVIAFWTGFEQAGGLMSLYTNEKVDRAFFGWIIPTAWFQSWNAIFVVLFAPPIAWLWGRLARSGRDLSIPAKMASGLFLMAIGFFFMVGAANESIATGKAAAWWVMGAYLFHSLGELCLSPVGLSMVSKVAPARMASAMMGVWFLANAAANKLSGAVGGLSERLGERDVFRYIAVGGCIAGGTLLLASRGVKWLMHGSDEVRSVTAAVPGPSDLAEQRLVGSD